MASYIVLGKNAPMVGILNPLIAPIAIWHDGNNQDPAQAARTTLHQMRALNKDSGRTFAIVIFEMPEDAEFG